MHETKSAHVADQALQPFLDPSFDPIDFLNSALPPLSFTSPPASASSSTNAVPLSDASNQAQTLLSQLNAYASRLSGTLTQLTDEILRSGSRLAYAVELLRGEAIGLSEALTETLHDDVVNFVPEGLTVTSNDATSEPEPSRHESAEAEPETDVKVSQWPPHLAQLRTLTLAKSRLDSVVKVFGEAMEWPLPPSEVSVASSFISVSAPEPGSEGHSREEKGQEVAQKLRKEIADLLLNNTSEEDGLEAAIERVQALRELAKVWKGTAEEKARLRFVESLIKMVEERQRALEKEAQAKRQQKEGYRPQSQSLTAGAAGLKPLAEVPKDDAQGKSGWSGKGAGYGFIDQLQRMRNGL